LKGARVGEGREGIGDEVGSISGSEWVRAIVDAMEMPAYDPESESSAEDGLFRGRVHRWLGRATLPLVTRTDRHSFGPLVQSGALLALGVMSTATKRGASMARSSAGWLARLASPFTGLLDSESREQFAFGLLDASEYADFVADYNISAAELAMGAAPRLLVVDPKSKVYYEDASVREDGDYATFLHDVARGLHPAQRSGVWRLPQ